jgi:hypothetical protein
MRSIRDSTPSGRSWRDGRILRPIVAPPIAEDLTSFKRIVDSTPQLKIGLGRQTTQRERDDVVELQATGRNAAALSADEGAASLIAGPDGPPNLCRHIPLPSTSATAAGASRRSRSGHRADFHALCLIQ